MTNILEPQGFEHELGGGGCTLLSRYFDSAGFVWATCTDGGGYPSPDDWHVCAYGDDLEEILFMARSDDVGAMALEQAVEQAVEQALAHARGFTSAHALCRNGNPVADCQCC